jgi:hypothetical protein
MFFVKITPDFGNTAGLEIVGQKNWQKQGSYLSQA